MKEKQVAANLKWASYNIILINFKACALLITILEKYLNLKSYPVCDNHNKIFLCRSQDTLESRTNEMIICVVYDEKASGKCKTAEESEVKLHNHMAYHVDKIYPSMCACLCR